MPRNKITRSAVYHGVCGVSPLNYDKYRYLCYKVDLIFGLKNCYGYGYDTQKPYIMSYYRRNKELIKKNSHRKYLLRKERLIKQKEEIKRIFLLHKKIDYLFGLRDSWW